MEKLKKFLKLKRFTAFAPFLSVLVLGGCVTVALQGYEVAAYDVDAPETVMEETEMQTGQEELDDTGSQDSEQESEMDEADENGMIDLAKIADGKYEGEGTGFGGKIRVCVEIKDHKIVSIEIISASGEDASFLERAKGVIDRILAAQSMEVDTVSGATYSSRGIIRAVKNALSGEKDDGQTAGASSSAAETPSISTVNEESTYQDGVYEGSGKGFAGEIKVRVTVTGGKIADIEIISHSDGVSYIKKASAVLTSIINSQSTNVDAVSGATYSSVGIVSAVRDALSKAVVQAETEPKEDEEPSAATGAFPYKDGIYYGTAAGFSGDLTVAIALQEKTIKAILVTKSEDDTGYLNRAKAVADEIIKKQSTNVDTVSGATYSSKGIREAVKEALKAAKKGNDGKGDGESGKENNPGNEGTVTGTIPYKEGVYFGSGTGFQGDVEVAIAISDKTIKAIVVTKTEDDETFFDRARAVIDQVLKKQSTKVDTVSGATYSSKGILEAIKDALSKAKKATENPGSDDNPPDNTENPGTETPGDETENPDDQDPEDDTKEPENTGGKIYQDGTYQVSVICYPDEGEEFESYTLSATVTIKQDKIVSVTNITGDGGSENNAFIKRAANGTGKKPGVVTQIVEKGDVQGVDAVSAATCSSQAIIDACSQALLKAKK